MNQCRYAKRFVAVLTVIACAYAVAEQRYYRYLNADGVVEISTSVPQQHKAQGYEVVDKDMMVIEVVDPALSDDDYQRVKAQREAARKRAAEERRVAMLYGSEEDIRYAEGVSLDAIDNAIARAKADLARLRAERVDLEARAAAQERAGSAPTGAVIRTIQALTKRITAREVETIELEDSKEDVRSRFARDLEVFRQLTRRQVGSR